MTREGFFNLENVDYQCYDLCKRLCGVCPASILGHVTGLMVSQLLELFLGRLRWNRRWDPFDWVTVGVAWVSV